MTMPGLQLADHARRARTICHASDRPLPAAVEPQHDRSGRIRVSSSRSCAARNVWKRAHCSRRRLRRHAEAVRSVGVREGRIVGMVPVAEREVEADAQTRRARRLHELARRGRRRSACARSRSRLASRRPEREAVVMLRRENRVLHPAALRVREPVACGVAPAARTSRRSRGRCRRARPGSDAGSARRRRAATRAPSRAGCRVPQWTKSPSRAPVEPGDGRVGGCAFGRHRSTSSSMQQFPVKLGHMLFTMVDPRARSGGRLQPVVRARPLLRRLPRRAVALRRPALGSAARAEGAPLPARERDRASRRRRRARYVAIY